MTSHAACSPLRILGIAGIAAVLLLAAASCQNNPGDAPAADAELAGQIAAGREVAARECSSCHALQPGDASPRADAPPMSDLLARYGADSLAEDLIEGIRVGHEDMPQFDFNVIAADSLVAYLKSLQRRPD